MDSDLLRDATHSPVSVLEQNMMLDGADDLLREFLTPVQTYNALRRRMEKNPLFLRRNCSYQRNKQPGSNRCRCMARVCVLDGFVDLAPQGVKADANPNPCSHPANNTNTNNNTNNNNNSTSGSRGGAAASSAPGGRQQRPPSSSSCLPPPVPHPSSSASSLSKHAMLLVSLTEEVEGKEGDKKEEEEEIPAAASAVSDPPSGSSPKGADEAPFRSSSQENGAEGRSTIENGTDRDGGGQRAFPLPCVAGRRKGGGGWGDSCGKTNGTGESEGKDRGRKRRRIEERGEGVKQFVVRSTFVHSVEILPAGSRRLAGDPWEVKDKERERKQGRQSVDIPMHGKTARRGGLFFGFRKVHTRAFSSPSGSSFSNALPLPSILEAFTRTGSLDVSLILMFRLLPSSFHISRCLDGSPTMSVNAPSSPHSCCTPTTSALSNEEENGSQETQPMQQCLNLRVRVVWLPCAYCKASAERRRMPSLVCFKYFTPDGAFRPSEVTESFSCPFCSASCSDFQALRAHLVLCHDLLRFSFPQDANSNSSSSHPPIVHVYCPAQEENETSTSRIRPFLFHRLKQSRRWQTHTRPATSAGEAGCSRKRTSAEDADAVGSLETGAAASNGQSSSSSSSRQFFRSQTWQPVPLPLLSLLPDSEDEREDMDMIAWEDRLLLGEFLDVDEEEKEVMHTWNMFMRKHRVLADIHIPWACQAFSCVHRAFLASSAKRRAMFMLFLVKLWNAKLVDAVTMDRSLQIVDNERRALVQKHPKNKAWVQ